LNRAKDQDLRPWTLDNDFDASIQRECDELDQTLERTSPFKKGGDFQYSKVFQVEDSKNDIHAIKIPVIKKAISSKSPKRPKSQRAKTPLIEFSNDEPEEKEVFTEMIADIAYPDNIPNASHSVKRFILSPSIIHKASSGVKQTNVYGNTRRKAAMRNIIHKPEQKYQNFIKKQAESESNERPTTAESYFEQDDQLNEGFFPILPLLPPSKQSPSSSPTKNMNLESLLSDIELFGPESDDFNVDSEASSGDTDEITQNWNKFMSQNNGILEIKRNSRPNTSQGCSRPNTAPAQINLNIQIENDKNGIINVENRRR
jgi:hypothetical protein